MLAAIDCQGEAPPFPVKVDMIHGPTSGLAFRCPCGARHEIWARDVDTRRHRGDGFLWTCTHCGKLLAVAGSI